jgi:DNA polymerase III epsilon subunit-like protein
MTQLITFVDLETSGLDPELNEILEMAAVRTEAGDGKLLVKAAEEFKINPTFPVDPRVASFNGYDAEEWEKDWDNLTTLPDALGQMFALMRDAWHAGSNPKFDEAFLKKAARDLRWDYTNRSRSYHLLDVTMLAFPLLLESKVEKLKQETVAGYYGIEGGGHRAMADAMQCARIFAHINNLEFKFHE